MTELSDVIRAAGILQLLLLTASLNVPRALNWKRELASLTPFLRTLFWVYGAFIVLTIIGFGVISIVHAPRLAAGDALARSFCGFVALFWIARLAVQFFVFDAEPVLKTRLLRCGYHALTVAFVLLAIAYTWAAVAPWVSAEVGSGAIGG